MSDYSESSQLHRQFKKAHKQGLEERISEQGLLWYSEDYFHAYKAVCSAYPIKVLTVKMYLLCHSIELALKSYLRSEGYSSKVLIDFDHDLMALIHELIEVFKVDVPEGILPVIQLVNYYYDTKQFEYFDRGSKTFPDLNQLQYFAEEILGIARSKVRGRG